MYWHLLTPTEHNMESVMRNWTASLSFSSFSIRATASHSELLATKRKDCLRTDDWEHLQLAELINLYKSCYFMRCFSQPWLNSMPYWFNILLFGSLDLSVTSPVIKPALVIASVCTWENLTRKTDWHYVNRGGEVRCKKKLDISGHSCLPASPSRATDTKDAGFWANSLCHSVCHLASNLYPQEEKAQTCV